MAERPERRRGRPPKNREPQSAQTPAESAGAAQPEVVQPNITETVEDVVEMPIDKITHRFMRGLYQPESDILNSLSDAQDELFENVGPVESFQALHSMTAVSLVEARGRNNPSLVDSLTNRQRSYASALRRLTQPQPGQGPITPTQPTNPSQLPPMTGRKG